MKYLSTALLVFFSLSPFHVLADQPNVGGIYLICYSGMSAFVMEDNELVHSWYEENGKCNVPRQSPDCYDRRVARTKLSKEQIGLIRSWVVEHDLFSLPSSYPLNKQGIISRASAYSYRLQLSMDDRSHSIEWDGDREVPEAVKDKLYDAVSAFERLCKKIEAEGITR